MAAVSAEASAAAKMATASSNVTVSVASAAQVAVESTLSAAEEFVVGVDTVNVSGERYISRLAAAHPTVLSRWVESGAAGMVPLVLAPKLALHLADLSEDLPTVSARGDEFAVAGSLFVWELRAKVLRSGWHGLSILIRDIRFHSQWTNPLWDLFGFPTERQKDRILAKAYTVVANFDPFDPSLLVLSDEALEVGTLPRIRPSVRMLLWAWVDTLAGVCWMGRRRVAALVTLLGLLGAVWRRAKNSLLLWRAKWFPKVGFVDFTWLSDPVVGEPGSPLSLAASSSGDSPLTAASDDLILDTNADSDWIDISCARRRGRADSPR